MELYVDADGRRWIHPPHYGLYTKGSSKPLLVYSTQEAAEAVKMVMYKYADREVPDWLGLIEIREIKGIEVVD